MEKPPQEHRNEARHRVLKGAQIAVIEKARDPNTVRQGSYPSLPALARTSGQLWAGLGPRFLSKIFARHDAVGLQSTFGVSAL
jgi:hypothetical protein